MSLYTRIFVHVVSNIRYKMIKFLLKNNFETYDNQVKTLTKKYAILYIEKINACCSKFTRLGL